MVVFDFFGLSLYVFPGSYFRSYSLSSVRDSSTCYLTFIKDIDFVTTFRLHVSWSQSPSFSISFPLSVESLISPFHAHPPTYQRLASIDGVSTSFPFRPGHGGRVGWSPCCTRVDGLYPCRRAVFHKREPVKREVPPGLIPSRHRGVGLHSIYSALR